MDIETIIATGTASFVEKAEGALPGVIIVVASVIALLFVWYFFRRNVRGR